VHSVSLSSVFVSQTVHGFVVLVGTVCFLPNLYGSWTQRLVTWLYSSSLRTVLCVLCSKKGNALCGEYVLPCVCRPILGTEPFVGIFIKFSIPIFVKFNTPIFVKFGTSIFVKFSTQIFVKFMYTNFREIQYTSSIQTVCRTCMSFGKSAKWQWHFT